MYIQERKDREGKTYFSISYVNEGGKVVRLKKSEHPHFNSKEEANEWVMAQEGIRASRKSALAKRLAWKKQYYNFEELAVKYSDWQKEKAPNTYKENVSYLRLYVFHFYLNIKKSGNINDWHLHFQDFLTYLKTEQPPDRGNRTRNLAFATQNNIIRTLNTFIECMKQHNLIDPASVVRCHRHQNHKLNSRDASFVIFPEERDRVFQIMRFKDQNTADFFLLLWHTGMRFNEGRGLSMESLFKGPVPNGPLAEEMTRTGITEYIGYIYLDSQLAKFDVRNEDGSIKRLPLKGRRKIDAKSARVIPIRDKAVWNILAGRFKAQKELFIAGKYGTDKKSYLFFDLPRSCINILNDAYKSLKMKSKGFHACRHSFVTFLVGETRSPFLTRMITGHKDNAVFEKYLHIYEDIARKAKVENQEIDVV